MAYLSVSNSERIEDASSDDLRQVFMREHVFQAELGDKGRKTQLNAAVVGDSTSLLVFADLKLQQSYKPEGRLDRSQVQYVLEYFLTHGDRDPSYKWIEVNLPFVQARRKGCLGTVLFLAGVVLLIWQCI